MAKRFEERAIGERGISARSAYPSFPTPDGGLVHAAGLGDFAD